MSDCVFCPPEAGRIIVATGVAIAFWSKFEVSPGHALIIPRRHVPYWHDLLGHERAAIMGLVPDVMAQIEDAHAPDGYNLGVNIGEAAGQTVMHCHLHVIPRYKGDVEDPRGGVRNVIPAKGNYLKTYGDAHGHGHPGCQICFGNDPAVQAALAARDADCDRPPAGWRCKRQPGHDGPCAAEPTCPHGNIYGHCFDCEEPR